MGDAGKLVRVWLTCAREANAGEASVEAIMGASKQNNLVLAPQIACPNSFAMAEFTSIGGFTSRKGEKLGAMHPSMIPRVVIFDPQLAESLPDWVRFGTAL